MALCRRDAAMDPIHPTHLSHSFQNLPIESYRYILCLSRVEMVTMQFFPESQLS